MKYSLTMMFIYLGYLYHLYLIWVLILLGLNLSCTICFLFSQSLLCSLYPYNEFSYATLGYCCLYVHFVWPSNQWRPLTDISSTHMHLWDLEITAYQITSKCKFLISFSNSPCDHLFCLLEPSPCILLR